MKHLEHCIEEVRARPAEMSARLDLADSLESHGKKRLATWMRMSCAESNALAPLGSTFPTLTVWGNLRWSSYVVKNDQHRGDGSAHWERVRPAYWKDAEHIRSGVYFGRWVFTCWAANSTGNEAAISELGSMSWLEDAWRDGLLELIEFVLGDAGTATRWLELPAATRELPLFLNSSRAFDKRMSVALCRRLFSQPSLVGLYLNSGIFPKGIVSDLPVLTPRVQFLSVEWEKRSREYEALVDSLSSLSELRFVSLFGNAFSDDRASALARSSSLSALGISSPHLSDAGLLTLASLPRLRWLGLGSSAVTRGGLNAFRRTCPGVHIDLSEDMQNRLGPVHSDCEATD